MKTPETSRLFSRWKHPTTGVESFVLTERLAPVQKSFYYVNRSFTDDGRFFWVVCMFVPPGGRNVVPVHGVIDFEKDEFNLYHETQASSTPMVDQRTGDLYWNQGYDIWRRGPLPGDKPVLISRFPKEIARHRMPSMLATHLTLSADGKSLSMDARFENECYIGDIPLDGSPMRIWQRLEGNYDHGIFSPTDSDLQLFAHEYWQDHRDDPFQHDLPYHRMWTIRRGEKARPVLKEPVSHSGHEWWDADGRHLWYVHYGVGIKKVVLETGEEQMVRPGSLSHAHSDQTSRYLVADTMEDPVVCDCIVIFRDIVTGREVEIVNRPPLAADLTQCGHLHPHPQFCLNDRYICHTTTIHDRVDVALVPVEPLIHRTQ